MLLYRIILSKYAATPLQASGRAARWNENGQFVLYTTENVALACLENVVHRMGEDMKHPYTLFTFETDDKAGITVIDPLPAGLPADWA
jgi:RES domain-containing protein